jgi:hypothetical protein
MKNETKAEEMHVMSHSLGGPLRRPIIEDRRTTII